MSERRRETYIEKERKGGRDAKRQKIVKEIEREREIDSTWRNSEV